MVTQATVWSPQIWQTVKIQENGGRGGISKQKKRFHERVDIGADFRVSENSAISHAVFSCIWFVGTISNVVTVIFVAAPA